MKKLNFCISVCLLFQSLIANDELKKAFSEGIKASVEVIKYEKSQALKSIPKGYCVTVIGKNAPLDMWEQVKLESLALFLELSPSLLASVNNDKDKNILCLSITKEKKDAVIALKKISKHYQKINTYITKIDILPIKTMHRVIPGVGQYFENSYDEIEALKQKMKPDRPLDSRIVLLSKKKKSKTLFDNGSTRVLQTPLKNVLYVEHTVYRRKIQ